MARRWPWAAIALAIAALTACAATPSGPQRSTPIGPALRAGLDLYEGGEFVLAARRFGEAASAAGALDERDLERRARTAECASWLRARQLAELGSCTASLEQLQRRARRPDPAVNTLIALGAIAAERPLPQLRLPNTVQPLIRATKSESM